MAHSQSQRESKKGEEKADDFQWKNALVAGAGTVAAVGIGTLIYMNWEDFKRYFKWGQLANDAAADSVVLLESKIDSAIALSGAPEVDLLSLKRAVDAASDEARDLVAINQQLRDKLRDAAQQGKLPRI